MSESESEPEPEGFVLVGVDRLLGAVALAAGSAGACFGLDGGWICAMPMALLSLMFTILVVTETQRRNR